VCPLSQSVRYVEKKTCELAVRAPRFADSPITIGAGLAEIGFTFESFTKQFFNLVLLMRLGEAEVCHDAIL
jgi:hypothetical protein